MNRTTTSLVYIAIGAGLIASLSQISLSIGPIPFTLQTLGVGLIASLYRPKEAIGSVAIYLLLGAIGLPVFAGASGGLQALLGPASGFLFGFLLYAGITAFLTTSKSSPQTVFLANILGDASCFLLGFLVFHWVSKASLHDTLAWTVTPFILPDMAKIALATLTHRLLQPALKQFPYFN